VIPSISYNQHDIIDWIKELHCPSGFDADFTYGNGSFWKRQSRPLHCFDLQPLSDFVIEADSGNLPVEDDTFLNVIFDPPFLTYVKAGRSHKDGKVAMTARFGGYWRYDELIDHYTRTIKEAQRTIKKKGVFVVKCQDIIHNHKMHSTHQKTINIAENNGFRLLDMFILNAKSRMPSPQKGQQRHARVFHSYFLVFKSLKK